jgi:hypothetical protein
LVENGCFRAVAFANAALGVVGLGLGMDLGMDLPATENAGKVRTNELQAGTRNGRPGLHVSGGVRYAVIKQKQKREGKVNCKKKGKHKAT